MNKLIKHLLHDKQVHMYRSCLDELPNKHLKDKKIKR